MGICGKCGNEIQIIDGVYMAHQQRDHVTFLCGDCNRNNKYKHEKEFVMGTLKELDDFELYDIIIDIKRLWRERVRRKK